MALFGMGAGDMTIGFKSEEGIFSFVPGTASVIDRRFVPLSV